jgi:hypothetical protein
MSGYHNFIFVGQEITQRNSFWITSVHITLTLRISLVFYL